MDYSELEAELFEKMYLFHKSKQLKGMNDSFQGEAIILQRLYLHGDDMLPSEISNDLSVSTARIAAVLGNLEKRGFITRQIDKSDRRRILVALTTEGKEIAKKQRKEIQNDMIKTLQKLGEHDAKEFVRIIGRLSEISNGSG